jgi:hypothetical protein
MVTPGLSCFFTSGSAVLEVGLGDGWRQLLSKKLSNSTLWGGSAAWLDRPQHGAAGSTIAHMGVTSPAPLAGVPTRGRRVPELITVDRGGGGGRGR